jgi:rubrerythrin
MDESRVSSEREVADGFELRGVVTTSTCNPMEAYEVTYHIGRDGSTREVSREKLHSKPGCIVAGRRPLGLVATLEPHARNPLGRVFARMAYLEAASVDAFVQLEEELIAHDAPLSLVRAAREARADEIDHAARMRALAERFGGRPRQVTVAPRTLRSAFELALDNAVEGCVRETFGALLATHQAEHAGDEEIRTTMRIVARDETRHAALSWRVAEFMNSNLTAQQLEQVRRAQQVALHDLVDEIEEPCRRERELLGTPSKQQARLLLSTLWPLVASQQSAA